MKNFYSILGMSLISAATFAQTANVAQMANAQIKNGAKAGLGTPYMGSANRAVYLTEDFSGTFPPASWTVQSEAGSTVTNPVQRWHLEANGNPGGCASVLYFNSVNQHNESIITPGITLPSGGSYRVAFDFNTSQYWHLADGILGGAFDNVDITVNVSTDDGATWGPVLWQEDDQALGEAAYSWPWAQYIWKKAYVNLSAYAGETVKIRWNYNGMDGAQFNLDNIEVSDIPANDLVLTKHSIGPYSKYPVGQERPVTLWAHAQNRGSAAQTNVTLDVTVGGTSVGTSSPVASLAPGAQDSLTTTVDYSPSGIGVKNLVFLVEGDQTEDVPANNTVTDQIEISANVFARDKGIYDGAGWSEIVIGANQDRVKAVGVFYETVSAAQATSITVILAEQTTDGAELRGEIFDGSGSELVSIGETDVHVVQASEINEAATATPVSVKLDFFAPVDLSASGAYFVAIWGDVDTVSVAREEENLSDDVLVFAGGSINDWTALTGGGYMPMIRLNLNEGITFSVEENETSAINVFPNPASNMINVTFAEINGDVTMQMFSADGKQVFAHNANVVSNQNTTLDVSGLSAGIYTLRVVADNGTYSQKVIVK